MTSPNNGAPNQLRLMVQYMAWANQTMLASVAELPDEEIYRPRQALFGNIARTFDHIMAVEDIFRAHLEGRKHQYLIRNSDECPSFEEIRAKIADLDRYYVRLTDDLSAADMDEMVNFEFLNGGRGAMRRTEILLHLVNHATYHRGFVSDMLQQIPFNVPPTDFTVFVQRGLPSIESLRFG
ncbi:MAG: DinB family protein [Sphingomonas sp.]|uniref:DinB family protein n=1 Tax=Sphingomonas sp. TaxID=28214 RepID=UPI00185B927A|nr:DinB family protein [Sphingomonas sp.]MBA3666657.1 DinB family protein [Sphingomonas sp.]